MKISEYHKSHGIYGVLRSRQTGMELHFNLEPGERRAPIELDVAGHSLTGYIEIERLYGIPEDQEVDVAFLVHLGNAAVETKETPRVNNRFEPGPGPNLTPLPKPSAVELPRVKVDRFDPGPSPELQELPEARIFSPGAPDPDDEDDGAGPNEVENQMAAEFSPGAATEKKAEVKEEKEVSRNAKKSRR